MVQQHPHYRGLMITLRHTTLVKNPLEEWSARRRDLYLTTHNNHNRQPCTLWDSNPQFQQANHCECYLTWVFDREALLAPHPTPKLEDHSLSAVRDCLFNIFVAILHIGSRNLRTRHAVVTGTHLSHGLIYNYLYIEIIQFLITTLKKYHLQIIQNPPQAISVRVERTGGAMRCSNILGFAVTLNIWYW
jgi:hypothetical protein